MSDKKDSKKKDKTLIEKLKALITEADSDSPGEGTGGNARRRKIDEIVDNAVEGANEDAKRR